MPNFWGYVVGTTVKFQHCPKGYCCSTTNCKGYNRCAMYRGGRLCGKCIEGYSEVRFFSFYEIYGHRRGYQVYFFVGDVHELSKINCLLPVRVNFLCRINRGWSRALLLIAISGLLNVYLCIVAIVSTFINPDGFV